jgi:hypothetical protein
MKQETLLEFWNSYKGFDESLKVRNSVYLKKEHIEFGEKMFRECLIELRDNATKLIEEIIKE